MSVRVPRIAPAFRALLSTYRVKDEQTHACDSCIMNMMPMRLEQLRQVDLNLLITFAALAEEKSITAAGIPPFLTRLP